jgi:hypothetical protein
MVYWHKLYDRRQEWESVDMVGVIPAERCTPAFLTHINSTLIDGSTLTTGYHQFTLDAKRRTYSSPIKSAFDTIFTKFKLPRTQRTTYNEWVCTPAKMIRFITWIDTVLKPCMATTPLGFEEILTLAASLPDHDSVSSITMMLVERMILSFFDSDTPDSVAFVRGVDPIMMEKELTVGQKTIQELTRALEEKKALVLECRRTIEQLRAEHDTATRELGDIKGDIDVATRELAGIKGQLTIASKELAETWMDIRKDSMRLIKQNNLTLLLKGCDESTTVDSSVVYGAILDKHLLECTSVVIDKPVRIYILCHTEERLVAAQSIYGNYSWAVPILMTYQDTTFENAFWKQLYEMRDDWYGCEMVGTLSFTAHKKRKLQDIDRIIRTPSLWASGFYHFWKSDLPITNRNHPYMLDIMTNVCKKLDLSVPTDNFCNYWMASPQKMIQFLVWFEEIARPVVMGHPLSMTDSTYTGSLTSLQLLDLCGVPYYPHAPFVFERLFLAFFNSLE